MSLLVRNAQLVNVLTSEIYRVDVAIENDVVVAVASDLTGGDEVIDAAGKFLLPGLIDGHIHVESSMLAPPGFARAVVRHGTTTTVSDPHEIGNVLGIPGIDYMLRASRDLPVNIFYSAPSCVPATSMETAGAMLGAAEIAQLLLRPGIVGVAEMMDFPSVVHGAPAVLAKAQAGRDRGVVVDGHCPGLVGESLQRYIAAGIDSDHEAYTAAEGLEKLRLGMQLFIREGSAARNLAALLPLVNGGNYPRCSFVCDDHYPDSLLRDGHIDDVLRRAVRQGLEPIRAVQLATINTAHFFGLRHPKSRRRLGAVAPGWHADMVLVDDLRDFAVRDVIKDGRLAVRDGGVGIDIPAVDDPVVHGTFHVRPFEVGALRIPMQQGDIRVIGVIENQLITKSLTMAPKEQGGVVVADVDRDLCKIASIERHRSTGNIGLGVIQGFGLRRGALAISVGHDSHNITVVGVDDHDMKAAVDEIIAMDGGAVVAASGQIVARIPLPVAGLMSHRTIEEVVADLDVLNRTARELGCRLPAPFITLGFMPLAVIPSLKLTDQGLVDVDRFEKVGLFV